MSLLGSAQQDLDRLAAALTAAAVAAPAGAGDGPIEAAPAVAAAIDTPDGPVEQALSVDPLHGLLAARLGQRAVLRQVERRREVDQVDVLMFRPDVLELHARRTMELYRVGDVVSLLSEKLDLHARLLGNLADGGIVGKLVLLDVSARRQPHAELAMQVEKHLPLPHHEHRHGEMPSRKVHAHGPRDYNAATQE